MNVRYFLLGLMLISTSAQAGIDMQEVWKQHQRMQAQEGFRTEPGRHCVQYPLFDGRVYTICQDLNSVPTGDPEKIMCKQIDGRLMCTFDDPREERF